MSSPEIANFRLSSRECLGLNFQISDWVKKPFELQITRPDYSIGDFNFFLSPHFRNLISCCILWQFSLKTSTADGDVAVEYVNRIFKKVYLTWFINPKAVLIRFQQRYGTSSSDYESNWSPLPTTRDRNVLKSAYFI